MENENIDIVPENQIGMFKDIKNNIPVIGIDPSLNSTGMFVIDRDKKGYGYTLGYEIKFSTKEQKIKRWLNITQKILEIMEKHKVRHAIIENAVFGMKLRVKEIAELKAVIETQIYLKYGTVPIDIVTISFQKYILGETRVQQGYKKDKEKNKPKYSKEETREYLEKKEGFCFNNLDESDAAGMAKVLWDYKNMDRNSLSQTKREVLKTIDEKLEIKKGNKVKEKNT